jgi:Nucleotidyl transferase of unknown function (DUF2204)
VTPVDPFQFAAHVARVLDAVGIRYVIGGSVASSFYGEPRSTLDLDIMIDADAKAVRALAEALEDEFYVDADAAVDAVKHVSTFNAIHIASAMKVDFFIAENLDEVRGQLDRRRSLAIGDAVLWFYAPEDIIVRKLVWFRMGGEVSERQWNDVTGMLRALRGRLDEAHLTRSAAELGVADLLDRARRL